MHSKNDLSNGQRLSYRFSLFVVAYLALHLIPLPHPARPIKSQIPDAHWQALSLTDAPYDFGYPWFTHTLGCLRKPLIFLSLYEGVLLVMSACCGYWLPLPWFCGRP